MRKTALVTMASILVLGMTASPAAGGGWWSSTTARPSVVAPGMTVRVANNGLVLSVAEAAAARRGETFFVYLIEDFNRRLLNRALSKGVPGDWWRLDGATATQLAPIQIVAGDSGLARARASFRMPRTPPGEYSLMICDEGCTRPLGDVIPTTLTVVRSPTVARLEVATDRMRGRLGRAEASTARLRVRMQRSLDEVGSLRGVVSTLRVEVSHLEGRLGRAEDASVPAWGALLWTSLGGAGVALAFLFYLRRNRARAPYRVWHELTVEDLLAEASISWDELERTRSR